MEGGWGSEWVCIWVDWLGTGESLPSARTAVVKAVAAKKARRSFMLSTMASQVIFLDVVHKTRLTFTFCERVPL